MVIAKAIMSAQSRHGIETDANCRLQEIQMMLSEAQRFAVAKHSTRELRFQNFEKPTTFVLQTTTSTTKSST